MTARRRLPQTALHRHVRRRWPDFERRMLERYGRGSGRPIRFTRWLPILLLISISLWGFAPPSFMRHLTPWVGAAALACAGLYLGRVVLLIGHFSMRHAERLGPALQALRRALYGMIGVLLGTLSVSAGFFFMSTRVLAQEGNGGEPGLLWGLTMGGMVLSLFFGELVTRLIEGVDEAFTRAASDDR
ncbi:hypothetical protein D0B54_20865 [Solimonas sp. K1W22B-7]|uniref:hypothetical protein n=1 Tax=Solimonas sp. K1W22B-7 TaxID=2303331 RepID=UPI000E336AFF|nr:hypothetical protein [Solimonas sp. K1W22B-7]AXQ30980.1 hypothetical protein D0B54_20865 [Solimonas sp. K1W22B-7]